MLIEKRPLRAEPQRIFMVKRNVFSILMACLLGLALASCYDGLGLLSPPDKDTGSQGGAEEITDHSFDSTWVDEDTGTEMVFDGDIVMFKVRDEEALKGSFEVDDDYIEIAIGEIHSSLLTIPGSTASLESLGIPPGWKTKDGWLEALESNFFLTNLGQYFPETKQAIINELSGQLDIAFMPVTFDFIGDDTLSGALLRQQVTFTRESEK